MKVIKTCHARPWLKELEKNQRMASAANVWHASQETTQQTFILIQNIRMIKK